MSKTQFASRFSAGKIDEQTGVIYGVSLMTEGPAIGHGMICDSTTLKQICDCAKQYQGGLKVKMTHRGDAGDIVGALKNIRIDGSKLLGDLFLLNTYEKRDYVLEIATKIPDTFGLSVSFSGMDEEKDGMVCARCSEIYSCDLVAEPAANPDGLFSIGTKVDAVDAGNSMTADEIKLAVKAAVDTALVEFGGRIKAVEDATKALAPSTDLAALKTQISELSTKLEVAKTELTAKIGDDAKRLELAAQSVAKEFAGVIGHSKVKADGGGDGGAGSSSQPDAIKEFGEKLTKHFEATKSKSAAWRLAMSEDKDGYAKFVAANARPSFDVKK